MAVFKPFCGVRPKSEYAQKVAALPYDVMSSEEAREAVKVTLFLSFMLIRQK